MFDDSVTYYSQIYGVPESWIKAIIQVESNWNPNAYNPNDPTGAWGLMQLLLSTARGLGYTGTGQGLFDPDTNIQLGTQLLAQLRASYGDDFREIASAYNSGSPTLWETSPQVAAYVDRAVTALASFVTEHPIASSAGVLIVGLIAFLLIRGKVWQ